MYDMAKKKIDNHSDKEVKKVEKKEDIVEEKKNPKKEEKQEEVKVAEKIEVEQKKESKHIFANFLFVLAILCSFVYFVFHLVDHNSSIMEILNSLFLTLFSIIYFVVCITSKKNHKAILGWSSVLLMAFFVISMLSTYDGGTISSTRVQDFSGKSLTEVVKWANQNKIKIIQEFEYSDMVPEYEVISQSIKPGEKMDDVDEIVVAISEGPNPYKEIVVPSMIGWTDERVLNFIKTNYLNHVIVEFIESDKVKDTVIEQSKSGNLQRNDELKLTFSYGDEGNSEDVTLIDFTNQSKFEIEFFMKQHHLIYAFEEDYSDSIKKGFGVSQSIAAGEIVKVNNDRIVITISKGPQIKIPDLKKMSISELTDWAIENRLKLEFIDQYDDAVASGKVISADVEMGTVVEQGTTIKVYLSLGKLKMPKFKSAEEFYTWADKYEIKYNVQHEFSDTVAVGEVIKFSYEKGQTIKNEDTIVVVISDGARKSVPDLTGYSKNEAVNKLEELGLNYNFIYRSSNTGKDKVIAQSISAGSEVSAGTTITVTLSSGKASNPTTNYSNNNNNNNNNTENTYTPPTPQPEPEPPKPTCNACTITGIKNVVRDAKAGGYDAVVNALRNHIQTQCAGININFYAVPDSGFGDGMFVEGFNGGDTDTCQTISIGLAKNN